MPFVFKRVALLLSISAGFAADKEPPPFKPAPAASFANHQTNAQVTIAVDPYVTDDKVKTAFGKLSPYQYGILPVLVVIQNDSDKAIKLDHIKAEYGGPNHNRVEATPARDVRYLKSADRPNAMPGPAPCSAILATKASSFVQSGITPGHAPEAYWKAYFRGKSGEVVAPER